MKHREEVMQILESFDLTRSYRDAGELAGCSPNTVADRRHYLVVETWTGVGDIVSGAPEVNCAGRPGRQQVEAGGAHEVEYEIELRLATVNRDGRRQEAQVRRGDPPPDGAALVLRGDLLEPAVLRESAMENHAIYRFYGVAVFVEVGDLTWQEIARAKLRRAGWIVLFEAAALVAAGVQLWDAGQSPHFDIVHDDLDELVARTLGCQHRVVPNPARTGELP